LSDYGDFGLVCDSACDMVNINRNFLGEPERSLEIFDQLAEGGDKQKETRIMMLPFITTELLSEKRYETILEGAENLYETLDLNFDGNEDHIGDFGHYYEAKREWSRVLKENSGNGGPRFRRWFPISKN